MHFFFFFCNYWCWIMMLQGFPETLINNSYWLLWIPSEQSPVQSSQRNTRIRWEIHAKTYMHLLNHLSFLTTRQERVKWHRRYLSAVFQLGYFGRHPILHIFIHRQLNTKLQKFSSLYFNVNVTTLCQWCYQPGFRVEPGQLVVCDSTFTCQENWYVNFNQFNNWDMEDSGNTKIPVTPPAI